MIRHIAEANCRHFHSSSENGIESHAEEVDAGVAFVGRFVGCAILIGLRQ
jgi:hypothetical protein